jgi:hypothetical protein
MRAGMGQQADESSGSMPSTPLDDEERALGRPMPLSVRSQAIPLRKTILSYGLGPVPQADILNARRLSS